MPQLPQQNPGLPIDSPDRRRLPPLLRRAWYSLNRTFRRRIAHTGVTPDQFTALRCLTESGPDGMTQSELSAKMTSDPNTIASMLERMEQSSLLIKLPHNHDRRAHHIQITPVGEVKYSQVRQLAIELQKDILKVLPETEREHFLEQLGRVADVCNELAKKTARKSRGPKMEPEK